MQSPINEAKMALIILGTSKLVRFFFFFTRISITHKRMRNKYNKTRSTSNRVEFSPFNSAYFINIIIPYNMMIIVNDQGIKYGDY